MHKAPLADLENMELFATPEMYNLKISPDTSRAAWVWESCGTSTICIRDLRSLKDEGVELDKSNYRLCAWSTKGDSITALHHMGTSSEPIRLSKVGERLPNLSSNKYDYKYIYWEFNDHTQTAFSSCVLFGHQNISPMQTVFLKHTIEDVEVIHVMDALYYVKPELNHDGTFLLYTLTDQKAQRTKILAFDIALRQEILILEAPLQSMLRATWNKHTNQVIVLTEVKDERMVGVFSPTKDGIRWIWKGRRNIEYVLSPTSSSEVCLYEIRSGRVECSLLDTYTGEESLFVQSTQQIVPSGYSVSEKNWVCLGFSYNHPSDLVLVDRKFSEGKAKTKSLTQLYKKLSFDTERIYSPQNITWKSGDGTNIQGWLYRNPNFNRGTIVLLHGGPHTIALDRFHPWIQYLVAKGYNVLEPNYRGSIGFGTEFKNKIYDDGWGSKEQEDIKTGIIHLLDIGVARECRIGVMGSSFGGYSALYQATVTSHDIINGVVAINAISDLAADYEDSSPQMKRYLEKCLGGSLEEISAKYRQRSPINHIKHLKADVLLVEGKLDRNVNPDQSSAFAEMSGRYGKRVRSLAFTNEGHRIEKKENQFQLLEQASAFFKQSFYKAYNGL